MIEDGSVLIRGTEIFAVGSTRRIENMKEARNAFEIDAADGIVMPGFVDPSFSITFSDDSIPSSKSRPPRLRDVYDDSLALMRSCLLHGTVAAEVKANAGGTCFRSDVPVLRQIAKIGKNPVNLMRTWKIARAPRSDEEIHDFLTTLETVSRRKLVDYVDVYGNVVPDLSDRLLAAIRSANLAIKLAWPGGAPDHLHRALTRCNPRTVSCTSFLTDAEAEVLSKFPSLIVFSPTKELGRASGSAIRRLADAGAALALSSGYDAASPTLSMQMAVSLAIVHAQLTPEEAITAATVNAAHAAGCALDGGTLEIGKRADILMLSVPDYREIPRQFGINHVSMVLREGNVVFNRNRSKIGTHDSAAGRVRSQHL
jgi:imidazolonepropionase